jgi:hypothetical protein
MTSGAQKYVVRVTIAVEVDGMVIADAQAERSFTAGIIAFSDRARETLLGMIRQTSDVDARMIARGISHRVDGNFRD